MPEYNVTVEIKSLRAPSKQDAEQHIVKLLGHAGYNVTKESASAREVPKAYRQTAAQTPTPTAPTEPKTAEAPKK